VDPKKPQRVAASLGEQFVPAGEATHRRSLMLTHRQVHAVVGMGPSAWHRDADALVARVAALPEPLVVTASVRLARYHPAGPARPG
jgi:23S rRNA (guanine745-N1)-methyltransferase